MEQKVALIPKNHYTHSRTGNAENFPKVNSDGFIDSQPRQQNNSKKYDHNQDIFRNV